jgi:pteridine reductase
MTPTSSDTLRTSLEEEISLGGETVLVTGGARRVGAAISRAIAARGGRVLVHTRRVGDEARHFVASLPSGAVLLTGDLSASDGPQRLLADAEAAGASVSAVVHAAASFVQARPLELDGAAWNDVFDLNLRAFYLLAQAFERHREDGGGSLVAIADSGALELCVSKSALIRLSEALAKAMAPRYRVNVVVPGPVLPPEQASAEEKDRIAARTLVGHLGEPEDVGRAVVFLLQNSFCTGTTLEVTGGAHLWRSRRATE